MRFARTTGSRRGVVLVATAIFMVTLIGFAALAIDLGYLYSCRTALQASVDSAALAAATRVNGRLTQEELSDLVNPIATFYAGENWVVGDPLLINAETDLVLGRFDALTNIFHPTLAR